MKNTLKKLLLLILSVTICMGSLSLFACGPAEEGGQGGGNQTETFVVTDDSDPPRFDATEIDLVKDGVTEYVLVMPSSPTAYENYAKEELITNFKEATNVTLQVVVDQTVSYDTSKKYISLGRTTLLANSGIVVDQAELSNDGYIIKREGSMIFICGGDSSGTIHGVYNFLFINFEWQYFSPTEVYMIKGINFKVLDYNLKSIPAIPHRAGVGRLGCQAYSALKYGFTTGGSTKKLFGEEAYYYFPHTTFKCVPPQTYAEAHPDWYAASRAQPCFSSKGFQERFIESGKSVLVANPGLDYFPIGAEDSMQYCNCDKCEEECDLYTRCGQIVRWANPIIDALDKFVKEEFPGRKVTFPLLAYYDTEYAPVITNPDGEMAPIDPSVVLHPAAPCLFAPMNTANHAFPINDRENNTAANKNWRGWDLCSSSKMYYFYGGSDLRSFEWADFMYVMTENAKFGAENNLVMFYQQGSDGAKNGWAFDTLFDYVMGKIMWDPYTNIPDLQANYFEKYYHEAGDIMKQYYYMMKAHYKLAVIKNNPTKPQFVEDPFGTMAYNNASYENKGFLEQMDALLDQAVAVITAGDYTQVELDDLIERIEHERFTIRFALLEYFSAEYQTDEYLAMVDEMEEKVYRYGIRYIMSRHQGNYTNEKKLREWRDRKA